MKPNHNIWTTKTFL